MNITAEGKGFEPSRPFAGALVSTEARPAVSGYLPSLQWTHRELNPDLRHARAVSCRWTMSPSNLPKWTAGESNPDLLRAEQVSCRWTSSPIAREPEVRSGLEPEPPPYRGGMPPITPADRVQSSRMESNHRFLDVTQTSLPLDHGTVPREAPRWHLPPRRDCQRVAGLGVEPSAPSL